MSKSMPVWRHIIVLFIACSGILLKTYAQNSIDAIVPNNLRFEENKNQWNDKVLFKVNIAGGRVFLEKNTLTFALHNLAELENLHHSKKERSELKHAFVKCHAYKMNFLNANPDPVIEPSEKLNYNYNYFIGNDSSKWASDVELYQSLTYKNLYPGIDLKIYGSENNLKYEYIVSPAAEPSKIILSYEGVDGIGISNNNLLINTSVSDVTEFTPFVYQLIYGKYKEVKCRYSLDEQNLVTFTFPDGYNENFFLIIDPVVVASTYAGSTEDTWGHCATYDTLGNIYEGGRSFGQGYPVTTGAYQVLFSGNVDLAIGKLNPTGSAFIYATYIGGTFDEYAQSMITDYSGNLYIYGSCGSTDYPVTSGSFDNSHNGGYDIIMTKLNPLGNALVGSTFVGGVANDGFNSIYFNYGDEYRGEIILDASDNPIVSSFSSSSNFPATAGAYDQTYNAGQDGVVFKMNSNLASMVWSTFLGGASDDAAFGLQVNSVGMIYVVGATAGNFPTTPVVMNPNYLGGLHDGFISILTSNGSSIIASTYLGTASRDELFFVDLDDDDNVYVYGLSEGVYPVTPGVYSSPGSNGRLIIKLDPTLNSVIFSTTFGSGAIVQGYNEFSPTAFLVDICQNIYVAGWGDTYGFPVTADAVQSTTDGSDFYLMVLKKDAVSLLYATFYGDPDPLPFDHVDGGTSRFDKNGIVYEAVCGCGDNFPTIPGSVSTVNNTWNCDVAVFKIDFQLGQVLAVADAAPNDTGCVPFTVNFTNNSNALDYFWDFGDGDTSSLYEPSHIYTALGTYNVMLIAIDSAKCNISDTTYLIIDVLPGPVVSLGNDTVICPGDSLLLDAGNPGMIYFWSTGESGQTIMVMDSGTYWVEVDNGICPSYDTISISVPVLNPLVDDTTSCEDSGLVLDAGVPGCIYLWSTGETTQTIIVTSDGTYWVNILIGNCSVVDTVDVVIVPSPVVFLGNDTVFCQSVSVILDAGNAGCQYNWSTGESTQVINVDTAGTYWVLVSNPYCSESDTIDISAVYPPYLGPDVLLCEENYFTLDAGPSHGIYLWSTGETTQTIGVNETGIYWVQISHLNCLVADTISIEKGGSFSVFFPNTFTPDADELNDVFKGYGEQITYYDLTIFTRWGQQIFRTNDPETGWDGTFEGVKVQHDVYVWMADYKTTCTGWNMQHKIGHVFLLR
ncbi:MAG: PKD domain-containing protein [Bacteroidota bacterium]